MQRFRSTSILKNVNKRHGDVTASCGLTFQTDPKNLEQKVDPWIAAINI